MQEENTCLTVLEVELQRETSRFPAAVGCFFVLHLLVKSVIVMAIARKAVKHIFILIQFFSYLGKQRLIVYYWCVKMDSPMGALNGLFDFWTPWNCQKIIYFLMVLGGGGA